MICCSRLECYCSHRCEDTAASVILNITLLLWKVVGFKTAEREHWSGLQMEVRWTRGGRKGRWQGITSTAALRCETVGAEVTPHHNNPLRRGCSFFTGQDNRSQNRVDCKAVVGFVCACACACACACMWVCVLLYKKVHSLTVWTTPGWGNLRVWTSPPWCHLYWCLSQYYTPRFAKKQQCTTV